MEDGLYHVNFKSNQQDFGVGIVAIKENKVNGGDYAYFYQGVIEENHLILRVNRFNDSATSVFGALKEFQLDLHIKPVMGYHILEGSIVGNAGMKIQIHAKKLAPLA